MKTSKSKSIQFLQKLSFVLPALIIFIIFVIYPFLSSIPYSLTQWDGISPPVYIGFGNYTRLFQEKSFLTAIYNTLWFCATLVISMPASLLLAVMLNRKFRGVGILRTIYYLPAVISLVVISILWSSILGYYGAINQVLQFIGLESYLKDWIGTISTVKPALFFVMLWQGTGYGAVIFLAGLQSIPGEINESAELDGAAGLTKFTRITFPLIMPSVTIYSFLALSGSLKLFDIPYIMTNGGPGNASATVALKVFTQAFKDQNYGYSTASGLILFVFVLFASVLQTSFTRKREVEL